MTINDIGHEYSEAKVSRCKESGCELSMEEMHDHIILKGEKLSGLLGYGNTRAVCDCFVIDIRNGVTVSIIELKSADLHASQIQKKFENSLCMAKALVQENCSSIGFHLVLVLLAKKYSTSAKKKLQAIRIGSRSMHHRVLLKKCGLALKSINEYEEERV